MLSQSLLSLPELKLLLTPHGPGQLLTADHKPQSLILSSALPPIPGKVVERIRAGLYIDLKELLQDNAAPLQCLQEVNTAVQVSMAAPYRMWDIRDPVTWASSLTACVVTWSDSQENRDILAFSQLVLLLARKHRGLGWVA